jgi:hypothetical protein
MRHGIQGRFVTTAIAAAVLAGAGCASGQPGAVEPAAVTATQQYTVQAVVEAIDAPARRLTLRAPGGRIITMDVPPQVRNFPQIAVGDRVRADYRDAVAVSIRRPGTGAQIRDEKVVSLAPPGQAPAASSVRTVELTATVTAIDASQRLLTMRGPRGNERTIHVDPSVERLGDLKVGDAVVVRLTEAVVLAVEKAP